MCGCSLHARTNRSLRSQHQEVSWRAQSPPHFPHPHRYFLSASTTSLHQIAGILFGIALPYGVSAPRHSGTSGKASVT